MQSLEPCWDGLPLGGRRIVAPPDVVEHPVGVGELDRETQDPVARPVRPRWPTTPGWSVWWTGRCRRVRQAVRCHRPAPTPAAVRRRPIPVAGASPSRRRARPRRGARSPTHSVTPSMSTAPSTESSAAAVGSTSQIEPARQIGHDVSLTASDPVIGCDSTIGCVILDEWPGPRLWIRSSPSGSASCCVLMGCDGWRPGSQSWQCSSRSTVICRLPRSTSGCASACRPKDQPPDLATIYRTVTTLVDQGVLHALTLEGGVTTYGLAPTRTITRCAHAAARSSKCPRDDWPLRCNMRWPAVRSRCPSVPASPCTDCARSVRVTDQGTPASRIVAS